MRILLVANTLPPRDLSGVGEQVLQLASGLEEQGHEVEVLGRGPNGAPGPKIFFPLLVGPAFVRRLRRFRPHVVQVHESDGVLVALLTKVLGGLSATEPLLVALLQVSYWQEILAVRALRYEGRTLGRPGLQELLFRYGRAPVHVALGALTAWLADVVLAPSRVTAEEIRRDYRVDDVYVVPNVTGGLEWDSEGTTAEAGSSKLLYVGRLRIRKGVEFLVEAMAELRRRGARPQLAIVGDGEQRQALESLVERQGLEGSIEFLGRRSPEEVRRLLATSGALVVPSIYEGMPLVILEAMERGVPVVASAVSGIPEVVEDGVTGWLVQSEDSDALADALESVFASAQEARRRGAAGRNRVAERFRPKDAARTWEELILRSSSAFAAPRAS